MRAQVRSLDIFPDCTGYAGTSIGGRVIIKYFPGYNKNYNGSTKDFSFKCHRQKSRQYTSTNNISDVFGINVIKFHIQTGVFLTGGDDGEMVMWDKDARSKLYTFNQMRITNYRNNTNNNNRYIQNAFMPIVDASYSSNGQYLVYATSYNWNKGKEFFDKNQQKPQVYLHQVNPKEVDKGKTKK